MSWWPAKTISVQITPSSALHSSVKLPCGKLLAQLASTPHGALKMGFEADVAVSQNCFALTENAAMYSIRGSMKMTGPYSHGQNLDKLPILGDGHQRFIYP